MDKTILSKYSDAKARIKQLRRTTEKLKDRLERLESTEYGMVSDTVSKGKRGKKPLGTVKITGFDVPKYQRTREQLKLRKEILRYQETNLLQLTNQVEEFIADIQDIELQNILTLYYIEDLMWMQVAYCMNELYKDRNYTTDSCRKKHERFLKSL